MSKRVCILSDTHGFIAPAILAQAASCQLAVHAGDIGNGEVLAALREACGEVVAVLGNNDQPQRWPDTDREQLAGLEERAHIALPGGMLAVEHGHRVNPAGSRHHKLRTRHPEARAIVYGHSHRLQVDQDAEPWVLNPGAAGRDRTFGGPSCLILTTGRHWTLQAFRHDREGR